MTTSQTTDRAQGNLLGGRFRVVQMLGDEVYGQTYLVEDTIATAMPRWIAKSFCLINKTNLQLDWARSLFQNQVPKLQQLSDRSNDFPKITTYFEQEEEFYIVEEAINGTRLSDEIATGRLYSESEVVNFLRQLLSSLHTAHQDNMVHGDINPCNLIRRKQETMGSFSNSHFVLTNFAILKGVYATAAQNGVILGTPSYTPYEQAIGEFTPSCDIYALGLTAIQLLTGLHPSQLVRRVDLNLLDWQMGANIRPELAQILNRMVKHYPEERYQSAREVLYDLDGIGFSSESSDFPIPNVTIATNTNRWVLSILCLAGIGLGAIAFQQYFPKWNLAGLNPPVTSSVQPDKKINYTERLNLKGHSGWVRSVAFFPNGFSFASGSYDRTLRLWNVSNNQSFGTLSNHLGSVSGINAIAVHPNGNTFATACIDKSIKLWNFRSGQPVRNLESHDGQVYSVAYSPDGKLLASASADQTIKIWDWRKGEPIKTFTGHQDKVVSLAFAPDGKTIASASSDKSIRLWDLKTGKVTLTISGHTSPVNAIAFSPDGKMLASGSQDETVKIWDAKTGKVIYSLTGHQGGVLAVAFNRDGSAIASGGVDQKIYLWNVKTGQIIQTLENHQAPVLSLSFSPKDATLVSGSADRSVRVWQTP
ncbi:MAG: hypothetical protein DCE90_03730 [Pseudanabaena sp.]|nr:MAG: hypothetical protein DCE90_03730 [Pseudanabaena sp.]